MANDDLCWMTAADLGSAIAKEKVSPVDVVDAVLTRIDKLGAGAPCEGSHQLRWH